MDYQSTGMGIRTQDSADLPRFLDCTCLAYAIEMLGAPETISTMNFGIYAGGRVYYYEDSVSSERMTLQL